MIPQKKLLPLTGYVHGGCSPVGMKKEFKNFYRFISRKLGLLLCKRWKSWYANKLNPKELVNLIDGEFADIKKE